MESIASNEKLEYIDKLERQISTIDKILKANTGNVINEEIRRQLKNYRVEASTVLRKLKNDEFEIAIVGLEKAGKSTFANALMENNLLPTKDTRCTFTSTQIEYSNDGNDSASVSFYTVDEFNNDFRDKLSTLGIENAEKYSYDTLSITEYHNLYDNNVSAEKKKLYGGTIHEDIISVIENECSLSTLLGSPTLSFSEERIDSGELNEYIVDESKARAVKQVVIHSKELREMKNAIIFDVPGFNSPTSLHKEQTKKRMKSADAIIVVASGASPSLTDESLKILNESDDEGNPLNDKLFVYANKIDTAKDIVQNIDATYKEWTKKKFVSENKKNRIIFGSALAHLQIKGLVSDSTGELAQYNLRSSLLPHGDGIDKIREELTKYNNTERLEVLKRRVNRINAEIINLFDGVRNNYIDGLAGGGYSSEHIRLSTILTHDAPLEIEKSLFKLRDEIKKNIPMEKPLSKQINEYIEQNVTRAKFGITDDEIENEKLKGNYTGTYEDTTRIEDRLREAKFEAMYEDFSQNVINIANNYHESYAEQILHRTLEAIGVDSSSQYYGVLREELKKQFEKYRCEYASSNEGMGIYYQSLIERFSRNIYEVLINSQYNSERLKTFYDKIDNFFCMSVFYKKDKPEDDLSYISVAPEDQPLCMMLLFHHCLTAVDNIRTISDNISKVTGIDELPQEVLDMIGRAYSSVYGNVKTIANSIADNLKNVRDLAEKTSDFKLGIVKNILFGLCEKNKPCSISDKENFRRYYNDYFSQLRGGKEYSVEDFCEEFGKDIDVLRDVLTNSFVHAISMETPFVAREVKSIGDIINYTKTTDFAQFLSGNLRKIKYIETSVLDKEQRIREQNAVIINEINDILNTLN